MNKDLLEDLTPAESAMLWKHIHWIMQFPKALPKFLSAVDWRDKHQVFSPRWFLFDAVEGEARPHRDAGLGEGAPRRCS